MSDHSPTPWRMNRDRHELYKGDLWPAIFEDADGNYIGTFYISDGRGRGETNACFLLKAVGTAEELVRDRDRLIHAMEGLLALFDVRCKGGREAAVEARNVIKVVKGMEEIDR